MIRKRISKNQIQILTTVLIFMLTSSFINFSTNFFDSSSASERIGEDIKEDTEIPPLNEKPVLSSFGEDPWWNGSFQYRRLINITNPHAEDLVDTIVSITFNYSDYVNDGKMNNSLYDVRIIENEVIRNYIIQIDYPNASLATVWFETNLTDPMKLEQDTYMYYGNETVNKAASYYNKDDRFGTNWWRLDDGEGTTPEDSIGTNDGIFQNSPIWVEGKVGGALDFVRTENDHVEMSGFYMGDSYVVAGWLKGGGSGHMPWGLQRDRIGGGVDLDTWFVGGYIYNNIGDSYSSPFRDEVSAQVPYPTDGQWHYFVVENIGGTSDKAELWIDGEWAGSATYHDPTTTNKKFQLSSWPYSDGYHWTGQIDDVRIFQYDLSAYDVESIYNLTAIPAELNEEQYKGIVETLEITVYDVDGRFVPHAHVSLVNMTVPEVVFTGETEEDGSLTFTKIPAGTYNITVKYNDTSSGMEYIAYNSTEENFGTPDDDMYTFTGLRHEIDLHVDLWTIDFEIVDWDGYPLKYAYINVSDPLSPTDPAIDNVRLVDGKGTFIWKNHTKYYYEIYYDNADYNTIPVHLNKSYIFRDNYDPAEKIYSQPIICVNNTNTLLPGSDYRVQETIFTNGSTEIGQKKLLKANITLTGMTDSLDFVKIYYIDKNGGFGDDNLIYFNDSYSGGQEDFIKINIRNTPEVSSNLIADNFEAYGLYIDVYGYNTTQCNGTIQVLTVEACHIYNITSLAKLQIRVIDIKPGDIPVQSCIVRVENSTGHTVTELITDGDGYAYGQINSESEFWFSRVSITENYTFFLNFYGNDKQFEVNVSDQYIPGSFVMNYNYTLIKNTTLVFKIQIDISDYLSKFIDVPGDIAVTWGENMTFSVNYTISNNKGVSWNYLNDPDEIICIVGNDNSKTMIRGVGNGIFTVTFNSSEFSAGDSSELYWVAISGSKLGYIDPEPVFSSVTIYALPTGMKAYNYSSLNELTTNEVSQYYGELINITLKYYDTTTITPMIAESFTYSWDYGSGSVGLDPMNPGYYTIEIDATDASVLGKYRIDFTASLENHTKIENFGVYINILSRPTELNGSTDVVFVSENIYALEAQNFTFNYVDLLSSNPVSNPDEMSYTWQKLYSNGDPIPGETDSGNLIELPTHEFILDLNTEFMTLGDYFVYVTLSKLNFEQRVAVMSLTILERLTSLNATEPIPPSFTINIGDSLNFTFSYIDTLSGNPITNLDKKTYNYSGDATGGGIMDYDPINEVYYMSGFNTVSLLDGTYTFTVNFEKENYTSQIDDFDLIINYIILDYRSFLNVMSVNPSNFTTEIFWKDNVSILFNYTTQYQSDPEVLDDPDTLYLQFRDESSNPIGTPINLLNFNISLHGEFSYTFNSSQFSFIGGQSYYINIYAGKTGYTPPISLLIFFKVLAVTTDLTIHDNASGIEFSSYTISEYWNTTLGITLYYVESVSSAPITDAHITFSWFYGSGQILPDVTKGAGYYSFLFNTGNTSEVGAYTITFLATKENYSNGVPVSTFIINVIDRPTMLDTSATVLYVSQKIYVQEAYNFTFEYIDFLTSNLIESADEMSFVLQKLDADGVPKPGESISGTLIETINHRYVMDLNTETLTYGEYSIVVTLNKDNYEFRVSIVSLTINKRVFAEVLSISTLTEIDSGGALQFQVTLTDPNNNSVPVIGATLYFTIQGTSHDLTDNGDGTYSLYIAFIADPFFLPEPYSGSLTIEKANFTTIVKDITVNVKMTEIFPGFPMFYFLMIVGAVIAVVGSLVAYRLIQQAKIPTFVKKAREMSKNIKGRKSISDSLLYPSKDELMVKKLGDRWEVLGLSFEEILGLDAIKKKKLPKTTDFEGGNA